MSKSVAAVGIWAGFGPSQNVLVRRESLHPSRIRNPYFINTNAAPKPMMPIATVPVSRILVEKIRQAGIDEIYAATHFLHDIIEAYYFRGGGIDTGIRGLWYQKVPLGTAPGAIMNILIRRGLREKDVVIFAGDIISDMDIAEAVRYHQATGSKCTIALNAVSAQEVPRFGTAQFVPTDGPFGKITGFREKMRARDALRSTIGNARLFLNNASFNVFDPEIFLTPIRLYDPFGIASQETTLVERMFPRIDRHFLRELKEGKISVESDEEAEHCLYRFGPHDPEFNDFGSHIFPQLANNGLINGYYFDRYWRDIGNNESYWFANWHALTARFRMTIPYPQVLPGVWMHPSVEVVDIRSLEPPVVLGKDVKVDVGARVGPFAVIDEGWELQRGVRVSYSVLWKRFADRAEYPKDRPLLRVFPGAVIEKSLIGGILPLPDHLFKVVMGDGKDVSGKIAIRTMVPLKVPPGSDITVIKQTRRILIVDKAGRFSNSLIHILDRKGWERIEVANNFEEASEKLARQNYDLIVLDPILSAEDEKDVPSGVRLLREQKLDPDAANHLTPVLFWSRSPNLKSLRGLSLTEMAQLIDLGVVLRDKSDEDVTTAKISDFLLKKLLEIEPR